MPHLARWRAGTAQNNSAERFSGLNIWGADLPLLLKLASFGELILI
jgi:hypothetical protein